MKPILANSDALAAFTMSVWLYLGWLAAAEPYRTRLTEIAKTMHDLHRNREQATAARLRSLFYYEVEEYRNVRHDFRIVTLCAYALPVLMWFLVSYIFTPTLACVCLLVLICTLARVLLRCRKRLGSISEKLQDVIITVHQSRTKAVIVLLIEAMEFPDTAIANRARLAVIDILPRLKEGDASLLGDSQRAFLHRALHGSNPELLLAVLQALERIGDRRAIPHVRRLTKCPLWIVDSDRISLTAQRCLVSLQARAEAEQASRVLLRSVSGSMTNSAVLLRPSYSSKTREPEYVPQADIELSDRSDVFQVVGPV